MEFSGENKEELPKTHTYGIETELKDAFKTGCTFGGWYTTSDCKSGSGPVNILAAGAYTEKDEKIVLYAKWTPNTYSVTYTENGGTIADKEKYTSYTYGEGLTLPKPTKTGYTFGGWYTDSACDGEPVTSITKTDTGEKTYYAKWTVNTYEITYKDQGNVTFSGTHEPDYPSVHTYGTVTTLKEASKTGYEFGGWYTTSDCAGEPVTRLLADSYTEETEEIILYAKWTANTYTVTYEKNEGTIVDESKYTSYTYGVGLTLPKPTKTGYTFGGWYTDAGFGGEAVTSITKTDIEDKTYYAKWTVNTYEITYKDQGNVGFSGTHEGTPPSRHTYGKDTELGTASKTGYTFGGWYTTSNCVGEAVTRLLADSYTEETEEIILYAKWTANTYTVTYTENGGTIAEKEKYTSYTYGVGLTLPKPTKTGYTFGGWYTDSACDGEPVTSITKTDTGEKTYYAKWTANTYEITYKDQGNVGFSGTHEGTPPSRHTYGKDTELGTASKTGYEFGGWYTTSDCGGNPVTRLLADSYTEEIILYAKWTANTYEVTYVYEGATGGNDKTGKEVTYGEAYGDLPEPVKTDYVFAGWHTEPDGKGQNVESTTNVTIADDHKLYAYWTDELYTVTYDYQGATGEDTVKSKSVAYGSTYGDLPEPTRKGYEFAGWYTAAENGERVTSGTDVLLKKDHTLYARWEDHTAPVIGTLKYNYEPKFFLDWLIGKDSLVITVPVTEEGSGADKITYVVTKTGESPQEEEEATIQNNKATITVNADFKGTIKIDCVDNAGNAATSVMVGPTGNGLIVEDKAPAISFEMKGGTLREDGCYGSAPAVEVTVADDIVLADTNENAVSSGLASITYRIDNDNESGTEQTVTGDFTQGIVTQHSFTISPEEIPIGISTITVIVEDNAGNISEEKLLVKIRGNVEVKAESGENAPKVNLPMGEEELEDAVLTEQERRELEEGKGIKISLIVKDISSTVSAEEVQEIEKGASNYTVGQYLDISMMKTVTVNGVAGEPSPIHNISKPIRVVIDIPLELKGEKHRDYAVVRLHEGQTTILEDMENPDDPDTITIETDRFSTYAIVYAEITGGELNPSPSTSPEPTPSAPAKPTPSTSPKLTPSATPPAAIIPKKEQEKNSITMMAGLKVSQTGKKISVKWGRVGEADGYQVYVQYCGKKFTSKPAKTVKGASVTKSTVTKINSKKLNLMKNYKVYIAAYKTVTGKKAVLGKTLIGHIVGKNNKAYTNVKQVKLAKSKFTIKAGKSVRIKAKTVLVDKTKKQLTDAHAKELRYKSTDTSVVTVSASGKVTAKGKGTCIVYVYARNGYAKKVTVKVK